MSARLVTRDEWAHSSYCRTRHRFFEKSEAAPDVALDGPERCGANRDIFQHKPAFADRSKRTRKGIMSRLDGFVLQLVATALVLTTTLAALARTRAVDPGAAAEECRGLGWNAGLRGWACLRRADAPALAARQEPVASEAAARAARAAEEWVPPAEPMGSEARRPADSGQHLRWVATDHGELRRGVEVSSRRRERGAGHDFRRFVVDRAGRAARLEHLAAIQSKLGRGCRRRLPRWWSRLVPKDLHAGQRRARGKKSSSSSTASTWIAPSG